MRALLLAALALAVVPAVVLLRGRADPAPDRLPPAQQMAAMHPLWQAFFQGCTDGNTGNEYLCACAGTYMLDKCARQGARTDAQYAECLRNGDVNEARRECIGYGELTTGGTVTPAPVMSPPGPEPAHLPRVSRLDRWLGSFQGCTQQATAAERARAPSIAYTCACLATWVVNACAPRDDVTNDHVQRCVDTIGGPRLEQVALRCDGWGALRMR